MSRPERVVPRPAVRLIVEHGGDVEAGAQTLLALLTGSRSRVVASEKKGTGVPFSCGDRDAAAQEEDEQDHVNAA